MASNLIRSFHALMVRLDLPSGLSPHACRHTAATNALYAGVPLQEVSHILGHANVAITAKIYAHVLPRGTGRGRKPSEGIGGLDLLRAWYARGNGAASSGAAGPRDNAEGVCGR